MEIYFFFFLLGIHSIIVLSQSPQKSLPLIYITIALIALLDLCPSLYL